MRGPNLATLGPLHTTSTASCVQPLLGPLPIGPVRSRGSTRSLGSARSGEPCSLPDGKMSNLANRANRLGSATVKAKYSLGCVLRADPMAPERMGGVGASLGSIEYKNSMPSPRERGESTHNERAALQPSAVRRRVLRSYQSLISLLEAESSMRRHKLTHNHDQTRPGLRTCSQTCATTPPPPPRPLSPRPRHATCAPLAGSIWAFLGRANLGSVQPWTR